MARKKRARGAPPRRAGAAGSGSETGAAAARDTSVEADVERAVTPPASASVAPDVEGSDSSLAASTGSVEALDPATPRIDIEHDDGAGASDVERGPP